MFAKKNDKDLIYGLSGHLFQLSKVEEIISVLTNEKVFIYKPHVSNLFLKFFIFIFKFILGCSCRHEYNASQKKSSDPLELRW